MREAAIDGAESIHKDGSHRYHSDLEHILTQYITPNIPEDMDAVHDAFSFWEEEVRDGGVTRCIL
jgi:hypothetical protein